MKKKDGSLRLCVDYRAVNAITERDVYPLLLITELYDRIQNAIIFTKLDPKNGYKLICIAAGEEWKTAFKTKFGLYEYLVMPFGLSNAPATFQRMVDSVLRPATCQNVPGNGTCANLDDVLVYSSNGRQDHIRKVNEVLELLDRNGLAVNGEKSEIMQEQVTFLGHMVGYGTLGMEDSKVEAVKKWKPMGPERTKVQVQEFLGFSNYYRHFINHYSDIAKPLTSLTGNAEYTWGPDLRILNSCLYI